jgi:ATP-dependent protease ClpP protease subunit
MYTASKFSDQARWRLTIGLAVAGAAVLLVVAGNSADEASHNTPLLLDPPSAGVIATASAMDNSVPSASEVFATATAAKFSDDQPDGF